MSFEGGFGEKSDDSRRRHGGDRFDSSWGYGRHRRLRGAERLRGRRRERGQRRGRDGRRSFAGREGRSGQLEAVDPESGFERSAVGADERVLVAANAVAAGDGGADGPSGRARRGGLVVGGRIRMVGDQAEPGAEPSQVSPDAGLGASGGASRGRDHPTARKARLEGGADDPESVAVGHDPSDVIATGAELNEREWATGHGGVRAGVWSGPAERSGAVVSRVGHRGSVLLFGTCPGSAPDFVRWMLPGQNPVVRPAGVGNPEPPKTTTASPGAGARRRLPERRG